MEISHLVLQNGWRSLGRLAVDKGLRWPSSPPGQRGWSKKYPGLLRTQASHSATWKGGGWFRSSGFPQPEPQTQQCPLQPSPGLFPPGLLSCFLDLFPGLLPAPPKIPSRKFVCCHKIMQMLLGCQATFSLCLQEHWRGRAGQVLSPSVDPCGHPDG